MVTVSGANDRPLRKSFEGRWIIGGPDDYERFEWEEEVCSRFEVSYPRGFQGHSVAVTKKGVIVVLGHIDDADPTFETFDDFDAFASATLDGRFFIIR